MIDQSAKPDVIEVKTFDHSSYNRVLIYTTGEVGGHEYKRGLTYMVDDATYTALQKAGVITDPDQTH